MEDTNTCVICLDDLNDDIEKVDCGHQFHKECCEKLMSLNCPVCRQNVHWSKDILRHIKHNIKHKTVDETESILLVQELEQEELAAAQLARTFHISEYEYNQQIMQLEMYEHMKRIKEAQETQSKKRKNNENRPRKKNSTRPKPKITKYDSHSDEQRPRKKHRISKYASESSEDLPRRKYCATKYESESSEELPKKKKYELESSEELPKKKTKSHKYDSESSEERHPRKHNKLTKKTRNVTKNLSESEEELPNKQQRITKSDKETLYKYKDDIYDKYNVSVKTLDVNAYNEQKLTTICSKLELSTRGSKKDKQKRIIWKLKSEYL